MYKMSSIDLFRTVDINGGTKEEGEGREVQWPYGYCA